MIDKATMGNHIKLYHTEASGCKGFISGNGLVLKSRKAIEGVEVADMGFLSDSGFATHYLGILSGLIFIFGSFAPLSTSYKKR